MAVDLNNIAGAGVAPDSILGQAISTVTDRMNYLDNLADKYTTALQSNLGALAGIKVDNVNPPTALAAPKVPLPVFDLGTPPVYQAGAYPMPSLPDPPSIDTLLTNLDVGDLGALPAAPVALPINIPDAPVMGSVAAPARPAIDTSVDIPAAPALAIPEMDALTAITLPDFTFPALPTFDGAPPDAGALVVPNVFINWSEPQYQSEMLGELQQQVRRMMAGGTGLPAPVVDALFARTRERDSAETARAVQEGVDTWAARGFSMPPGMLIAQADALRQQGRLKAAETNRDILIEASKWEIENLRFAVQQGMALEQLTQNLFENMAKRLFEGPLCDGGVVHAATPSNATRSGCASTLMFSSPETSCPRRNRSLPGRSWPIPEMGGTDRWHHGRPCAQRLYGKRSGPA